VTAVTTGTAATTRARFGARLRAAMDAHGPLCVGIDPHPGLLEAWDLPDTVEGLQTFAGRCVEAFAGTVACVKPQSAFFERFGSAGIAVLERTLRDLREAGTLSLLDIKRGDIGSTMTAYAQAYLGQDSPLRADAVTLSPYLGYESLRPALDLAEGTGRGVFVLALTSNPEGASVQHASLDRRSVAGRVVDGVAADNAGAHPLGSVGMVVGATVGRAVRELGLDLAAANAPLLAPGVGAQGGTVEDLREVFGAALPNVLASSSREVLGAGPGTRALTAAARDTGERLARTLRG
jgi:orotidine-5'-phosphate decarboxylase